MAIKRPRLFLSCSILLFHIIPQRRRKNKRTVLIISVSCESVWVAEVPEIIGGVRKNERRPKGAMEETETWEPSQEVEGSRLTDIRGLTFLRYKTRRLASLDHLDGLSGLQHTFVVKAKSTLENIQLMDICTLLFHIVNLINMRLFWK